MKLTSAKRFMAYAVAACTAAQPAFAAPTDISTVPLASSAGTSFLPNLLFTLDDSGSMGFNYLPDYVNDNNTCMVRMEGNNARTNCERGDPPFEAGGEFGFNGVGYDPNFNYQVGLSSDGQPVLNPPSGTLNPSSVPADAYLGGGNVDVNTSSTDKRYCNANGVCKRNGADDAGTVLPVGIDVQSFTQANILGPGQFPYRTNPSSASLTTFGLPEMMSIGSFSRNGNTITATTVEPHGLATNDVVYVTGTGSGSFDRTAAVVTVVTANQFRYTGGNTGASPRNGSYRKHGPGTFQRAGNIVTVTTPTNHLLVTGDIVTTVVPAQTAMSVTDATITKINDTQFTYTTGGSGNIPATPGIGIRSGLYNIENTVTGPPAVYSITPIEYCSDVTLTNCIQVIPPAAAPASHPFAAHVRFCKTQADAYAPGPVAGNSIVAPATAATPRCQLKFVNSTGLTQYIYPRFGWFKRDTVVPGVATYGNRPGRSDCAAPPNCTFAEEVQNYSRWLTYYGNRMRMMKTSAGRAFLSFVSNPTGNPPRPDRLRVGLITINPTTPNGSSSAGSDVDVSKYLKIDNFNTTHAGNWYNKFYAMIPNQSTPLRPALSRAGWIFSGKLNTGLTAGIPTADDPLQSSCQKNYSIFTTDGFWNQGPGYTLAGTAAANEILNMDNVEAAPYVTRGTGTFDGNVLPGTTAGTQPGGRGTLADVAMYYYKTDLRGGKDQFGNPTGPATSPNTPGAGGGDVAQNNVPPSARDFAPHQHMVTFTIGLVDGLMRYDSRYETDISSDFSKIATGATGCFWAAGVCNWPAPQADNQTALDDLWHAAVNGRGTFYSARNPNLLARGLTGALSSLDLQKASAAAAATSSPNIASGIEKAFSTIYETANWSGRVYAQQINPITGDVALTKDWQAHERLLTLVSDDINVPTDQRNIWMFDSGAADKVAEFRYANLRAVEKPFFENKCDPVGTMTQCGFLSITDLAIANEPDNLIAFLRGWTGQDGLVFRRRIDTVDPNVPPVRTVLGDIVNAQPVFVKGALFDFTDPGYTTFRDNMNTTRAGTVYVAANDGYLHAFDGNTGVENWAYVPKFVMPAMYLLADVSYATKHRFFVDGTPEVHDVFDTGAGVWKTILVGGANSGARGFYALDITNPAKPKGLWEFCSDPTLCAITDPDLGFSYGNPVIGKRFSDGKWVVVLTSGLNNVPPPAPGVGTGDGGGYFYVLDAITGKILHKVGNKSGDPVNPSGLMKVGAWYPDGRTDATFTHVYGGDQKGQVWRMDMQQPGMTGYLVPTDVTTGMPFVGLLATLQDDAGRAQPLTARPVGTYVGTAPVPGNPALNRIYYVGTGRYLGNSDLTDPGAGGPAWQQTIYAVRDRLDDPGFTPIANFRTGNVVRQTLTDIGGAPPRRSVSKAPVDWTSQDGFYIDLNPGGSTDGERVVLDLHLVLGTLIVTSTIPPDGVGCELGGTSYQYNLDFRTGGYVGNSAPALGSGVKSKLIVGAAIVQTRDGTIKAINKTYEGDNITSPVQVEPYTTMKRFSYRERF